MTLQSGEWVICDRHRLWMSAHRALEEVGRQRAIRIAYVNLYELADGTEGSANPELHSGLLRTDFSEKPAAEAVRRFLGGRRLSTFLGPSTRKHPA